MKQRIKKYPITFGLLLLISAYFCDTFGILFNSGDLIYKVLNLIGALFIAVPLLKFKNYQAFFIAAIWFIISFYAVFNSVF